jgi:hypothetical protein
VAIVWNAPWRIGSPKMCGENFYPCVSLQYFVYYHDNNNNNKQSILDARPSAMRKGKNFHHAFLGCYGETEIQYWPILQPPSNFLKYHNAVFARHHIPNTIQKYYYIIKHYFMP